MSSADLVLVTFQYKVIALRKSNGEKLWETMLVNRFFKPADAFVALVIDDQAIYAHVINEMFCLELLTGRILWQKELGPLGLFGNVGIPAIAIAGSNPATLSSQAASFKAIQSRKNDGGGA
jgi:outer membrane protein assembly factor BamB